MLIKAFIRAFSNYFLYLNSIINYILKNNKNRPLIQGGIIINNRIKDGTIPTALGTVVTGLGMKIKNNNPSLGWGVTGFGLAHILLGTIDLMEQKNRSKFINF
ncbi:MAG: hypothetical protein ACQERJ_05385 [Bacillota bacterium]